ncbi:FAD-binding oxidoreductase [Tropicimonas sp. IMCC6043]|uniref:NAD(P)/FAD-dependent oxidoreductase n=1 Tax=Tropicimonas sp. IMCC6043 TaxID=2510645 RepID=UPI00101E03CD|nr:FAD-dependent oxidoreductase [Tropicimonas sp. IMCC6043]RYH08510.1 FAD-binding oxidoreductase [Tropicimonas sp. IMCC6043]
MKDFLVIGGGIAGVSAAAELAAHGSVVVLETEAALGYHASGRSAAMFLEGYGNRVVRALNAASAPAHQEIGVLTPRSFLIVGGLGQEAAFAESREAFGAEEITPAEAASIWPILDTGHCTKAAWLDTAADLDTDLLLQHFARRARKAGAEILTRAPATEISRTPDGWRVGTPDGPHHARHLVNAAGAWSDLVAQTAGIAPLGIRPLRRSMARLPAPDGLDTRDWPFVDAADESWYAKPDAGAWLVSPGDEDPVEPHDAWADDMVIAEGLARYQDFARVDVTRVETTWAGLRSFAPDRALVIGRDPADPTFLWCAGQGGYGFQTAPAAARLLAALATGTPPDLDAALVAALLPARFAR